MDADQAYGEKAWRQLYKNATDSIEQIQEISSCKTAALRPPTTHHPLRKPSELDEQDVRDTAGEVRTNS